MSARSPSSNAFAEPDMLSSNEAPVPALRPGGRLVSLRGAIAVDHMLLAGLCTASIGFFAIAYSISLQDPDYFSRQQISSYRASNVDPITTGAIGAGEGETIPVPRVVRSTPPVPADYQIVMVFENEAILATSDELLRVKVGSILPGLGKILQIDATDTGGIVQATDATLRSVTR